MMLLKYLITTLILILCFSFYKGQAQKAWTLQECIIYALDNNIQIKRQELQSELAKNNYNQSRYQVLPNLNAGGSHNWNFGRNVDRYTNEITNTTVVSDNVSIQSSVTLFSGFQILNTIQQNRYLMEKSLQDYSKAKNDMCLQIATVFLQILFSEEALTIAESQLEVTSLQVEKTKKLVDVGNKAKGELMQIQAQEASEKYNVITARNNLKIANLTLAQLLELKNDNDFKISRPDSIHFDYKNVVATVDDIYKEAEAKLPEIKTTEYDQKISETALAIARGQRSPTLTLSGSYGSGYSNARQRTDSLGNTISTVGYVNGDLNMPVLFPTQIPYSGKYPFFSQLKDNAYKTLSISLSVPIFNNFVVNKNINNANIRLKDASYGLEQSKKNLYKEIQTAHADAQAAIEKYNAANEAIAYNEESFKYTQQKFDVGLVSSVDYNVAKNSLTKAKSDLIQAKYEYIFKIKVLDFYRGIAITLD